MKISSTTLHPDAVSSKLKTSLIYSLNHLFAYLVEIVNGSEHQYLSAHGEPLKFGNLQEAREAAFYQTCLRRFSSNATSRWRT